MHTLPHSPIHAVQGSMSPPTPRSMPSSPSRIPFGHVVAMPGGATLPRDRISNAPPSRSITPCSSAILERRDVKPDEDLSSKSVTLYSEAYGSPEARLSVSSSQGSHTGDVPDAVAYIQHRSAIKSVGHTQMARICITPSTDRNLASTVRVNSPAWVPKHRLLLLTGSE